MTWVSILAVYFVTWWICLFLVLPFGVRNQADTGEIIEGTEPGAPVNLRMWPKLLATSVLAAVVVALLFWGISNPILQRYWS